MVDPDPYLHQSGKLDLDPDTNPHLSQNRAVEAQNGFMEGADTGWRREGSKWSRGGSIDQWQQIPITLVSTVA